jgi:hypothetical protein
MYSQLRDSIASQCFTLLIRHCLKQFKALTTPHLRLIFSASPYIIPNERFVDQKHYYFKIVKTNVFRPSAHRSSPPNGAMIK